MVHRTILLLGGLVPPDVDPVNQYLAAGLIDELRLHVAPVIVGAGERLFDGVADLALEPLGVRGTNLVTHVRYRVAREASRSTDADGGLG